MGICLVYDLTVIAQGELGFRVDVAEDGRAVSAHTVTVPRDLLDDLAIAPADAERLVRESFAFLLEREPPSQILREFDLDVIGRYFPEYRTEIAGRIAS
jgi:hypothetical protein